MPVDKQGNTISKKDAGAAKKLAEERAAAKARREAKAAAAAQQQAAEPPKAAPAKKEKKVKKPNEAEAKQLEEIKKKVAAGETISSKEKRLLKKFGETEVSAAPVAEVAEDAGLPKYYDRSVTVTVKGAEGAVTSEQDQKSGPPSIVVPSFSVDAGDRPLLVDARLQLVGGRKYGLLGPNGTGKSTLLRLLASKRLPMPEGVKVVLVEQEVEACTDMSVTEQVLSADEERAALLAEEKKLTAEMEAAERAEEGGGEDEWDDKKWLEVIERLEEVSTQLEACGGWGAEAKAARIIKGLGFSQKMADSPSIQLSGGWRMRVALAKALYQTSSSTSSSTSHGFGGGELLLLDEPTNHLDLNAAIWLEEHLSKRHKVLLLVLVLLILLVSFFSHPYSQGHGTGGVARCGFFGGGLH
jgi:ATPase subunit of ABC transporter with duplicated ATPase domains